MIFLFKSCFSQKLICYLFSDAPHISVEHPRLETGYGEAKELVCMVHAHPKAKVGLQDGNENKFNQSMVNELPLDEYHIDNL